MLELTDDTFDELVQGSDLPVLVEFTAAWCAPCRAMAPVLEAIATEMEKELVVAALDVDRNPNVVARYAVFGMPTLLLFRGGEEKRRIIGARGKGRLLAELAEELSEAGT